MIISSGAFAVLVTVALAITIAAPIVLLLMLIRDWKKGQLW